MSTKILLRILADKVTAAELADALLEDLESKLPVLMQQFPEFTRDEIVEIARADPTPQNKYTAWLLRLSRQRRMREEDFANVAEALRKYDWLKNREDFEGERDINRYRTVEDLFEVVQRHSPQRALGIDKEPELCRGDLCVFKFERDEAASLMRLSQDVAWCVKDRSTAMSYLGRGPMYVVTKNNRLYALASTGGEVRDVHDRNLSDAALLEIAPLFNDLGLVEPFTQARRDTEEFERVAEDMFSQLREINIGTRIHGYHNKNGTFVPGVSRQQAEQQWALVEPAFREMCFNPPEEIMDRFYSGFKRPSTYNRMYDLGHAAGLF